MSIDGRKDVPERSTIGGADELTLSSPARFADVYRDHHQAVAAVARRVCGADHAIDVTQEVFVALWNHPEKFDPSRGSLRSYLLISAHHVAVDVLRSETARVAREHRVDAEGSHTPAKVEDRLLRFEVGRGVASAVASLPASERQAIVSAFYEHRSYRATAQWLEVPEGTIKSRIRSGLKRLHPLLSEQGGDAVPSASLLTADRAESHRRSRGGAHVRET